jgi:hypothetical protein
MQPNSLDKLLLTRQLRSGGWSYFGSQQSSVETTSLAVMALSTEWPEATQPGLEHLTLLQRRDGGWPAFLGDSDSSWTTALVSCALNGTGEFQSIREKAFHCEFSATLPREVESGRRQGYFGFLPAGLTLRNSLSHL